MSQIGTITSNSSIEDINRAITTEKFGEVNDLKLYINKLRKIGGMFNVEYGGANSSVLSAVENSQHVNVAMNAFNKLGPNPTTEQIAKMLKESGLPVNKLADFAKSVGFDVARIGKIAEKLGVTAEQIEEAKKQLNILTAPPGQGPAAVQDADQAADQAAKTVPASAAVPGVEDLNVNKGPTEDQDPAAVPGVEDLNVNKTPAPAPDPTEDHYPAAVPGVEDLNVNKTPAPAPDPTAAATVTVTAVPDPDPPKGGTRRRRKNRKNAKTAKRRKSKRRYAKK